MVGEAVRWWNACGFRVKLPRILVGVVCPSSEEIAFPPDLRGTFMTSTLKI